MRDVEKIWNEIKEEVNKTNVDVEKHLGGNKSAGQRVRKASMNIRNLCKELKASSMELSKK